MQFRLAYLLILVALLCSACSSGNTRFYLLNPLQNNELIASSNHELAVEISSIRLPQYLQRPQIVTRSGNNQLVLAEFAQWAGNLRKNIIRTVAENLSHQLATPMVTSAPNHAGYEPDTFIEIEIMQFERLANGKVSLVARWQLFDKSGRQYQTHTSRLLSKSIASSMDYEATVAAMSILLGELSQQISTAILNQT